MDITKLITTLRIAEADITKLKKKVKQYQRSGNFSQIGWRKKLLTKLKRRVTLIYRVLESYNNLEREWINLN